jgi:chromosome segregation ATPase
VPPFMNERKNMKSKIELLRKRNTELSTQLDDLKFQLEYQKVLQGGSTKRAKDLIVELENIKTEWEKSLSEIDDYKSQYEELIAELRDIKESMIELMKRPKRKNKLHTIKEKLFSRTER